MMSTWHIAQWLPCCATFHAILHTLKVHLMIHSLIQPSFSKKVRVFILVAFKYMFVFKIFLANSFVWQNNCQIVDLLCQHNTYQVLYSAYTWYVNMHNWNCNLRIDWQYGNKPILSVSTELGNRSSMPGSRNGPLSEV